MKRLRICSLLCALALMTPALPQSLKAKLLSSDLKVKDKYEPYLGITKGSPSGVWLFTIEFTNSGKDKLFVRPVFVEFDNKGTEFLWRFREFYSTIQTIEVQNPLDYGTVLRTNREGTAPRVPATPMFELLPGQTRSLQFFSEDKTGFIEQKRSSVTRNGASYWTDAKRVDRQPTLFSFSVYPVLPEIEKLLTQARSSEEIDVDYKNDPIKSANAAFEQYQWFGRRLSLIKNTLQPLVLQVNAVAKPKR